MDETHEKKKNFSKYHSWHIEQTSNSCFGNSYSQNNNAELRFGY